MSRLALGITLSLVAIAIAAAGCVSYFRSVGFVCPLAPRAVFVTHFFDGRMRLFWITRDDEAIQVTQHWRGPYLEIVARRSLTWQGGRYVVGDSRTAMRDGRITRINIGDRRSVSPFGGQWRSGGVAQPAAPSGLQVSFIRFPVWLPVILLLFQPIKAILLGPWRTRRRERLNQCIGCGYDLTALPTPRCPECGRFLLSDD